MEEVAYHHGNLRKELLEAGIRMINEEGIEKLSMRKLAVRCKVSHGAPYAHFSNKEQFLAEMKAYVLERFSSILQDTIDKNQRKGNVMVELGIAYVLFFQQNPHFYQFLIGQNYLEVQIGRGEITTKGCEPFEIFKRMAVITLNSMGVIKEEQSECILTMWAIVQGLASLVTMESVVFEESIEGVVERILVNRIKL